MADCRSLEPQRVTVDTEKLPCVCWEGQASGTVSLLDKTGFWFERKRKKITLMVSIPKAVDYF